MENVSLKKLQKKLKNYFTYFKHNDILIVSNDKSELPFAYLINDDENHPDEVLISFSVDFCNAASVAQFVLEINENSDVLVTESFYISKSGMTHWGEEAFKMFTIDNVIDLEGLAAISEVIN